MVAARRTRRLGATSRAGLIAGVLPAFVTLGGERLLPPRTADRVEPPLPLLQELGVDTHALTSHLSGLEVTWASSPTSSSSRSSA